MATFEANNPLVGGMNFGVEATLQATPTLEFILEQTVQESLALAAFAIDGMATLTPDEIEHYRAALIDDPIATRSLNMIEDCEGDLQDAAIALALRSGQEPGESEQWLERYAKRFRVALCQSDLRTLLDSGDLPQAVRSLATSTDVPAALATPVVLYVLKVGIEDFCKPLEEKL